VSLLSWQSGRPVIELVHRFPNSPVVAEDSALRWPLETILAGVDHGLNLCAEQAGSPIRSLAVDGWAVDYVRLHEQGEPLDRPFCYRDERTIHAEKSLHAIISPERLRALTGVQLQRINTVYQLHADHLEGLPSGVLWLNLPEYLLMRLGGKAVAEYTNATHTGMVGLNDRQWSLEILRAAGIVPETMPTLVQPGTILGQLRGELARLPVFRDTTLIAPACHDTASAVAGIPSNDDDWAYISSGTWSLVGTVLGSPCNGPAARAHGFTNLGGIGNSICFHRSVNGMWLLRRCIDAWSEAGAPWTIEELIRQAERAGPPHALFDVDEPALLSFGPMPTLINAQLLGKGYAPVDESPSHAPAMASLIFHSLADRFREVLERLAAATGKQIGKLYFVGGGSRNAMLRRLTAEATGLEVIPGSAESSTIGNFAVQLATLEADAVHDVSFRARVASWAAALLAD